MCFEVSGCNCESSYVCKALEVALELLNFRWAHVVLTLLCAETFWVPAKCN